MFQSVTSSTTANEINSSRKSYKNIKEYFSASNTTVATTKTMEQENTTPDAAITTTATTTTTMPLKQTMSPVLAMSSPPPPNEAPPQPMNINDALPTSIEEQHLQNTNKKRDFYGETDNVYAYQNENDDYEDDDDDDDDDDDETTKPFQPINEVVAGCGMGMDNNNNADSMVESNGGGDSGGQVHMDESEDDAGNESDVGDDHYDDDDDDDFADDEGPTGIIVGTGNGDPAEMARKVKSMLRESARDQALSTVSSVNTMGVDGDNRFNKLDEDGGDMSAVKYKRLNDVVDPVNPAIDRIGSSGGGSSKSSNNANIKRKRKTVASCVIDFITFLKIVMTMHKYMMYHNKPIGVVDPSLFDEDIEKLKLDSNNKLKQMQRRDVAFHEYNVNKHRFSNHQRLLLVQSLAIALERKNVTVLYSISYLKFVLATFSTYLKAAHFIHVQHELPSSLSQTQQQQQQQQQQAQEFSDKVMKTARTSHNVATEQQRQKQILGGGGGGRHNKNQTKLSSGAILGEYGKNFSNFAVAVSKATRNDLEGLNYMRVNRMTLNRSILNIFLLHVAHKVVETRDRCMRPDHVAVNITQMKHLFIGVTRFMFCVWEDDRFVLPVLSLEREIGSDSLNDVKLDDHYAILEVAISHSSRIIIDVLETSHPQLADDARLPYRERIARFCNYFGPKWSVPSYVEQTMDSHSAYIQLPNDAVSPNGDGTVNLVCYYHAKPLHTVCAFGVCGPDVLIAYHRGKNEFEYKLTVPNNTTLNITFMANPIDTVKRAIANGIQATTAASSNRDPTDADMMPPPASPNISAASTDKKIFLIDDVLTYSFDPNMRIYEFGQVLTTTAENGHSIVLFHQPLKVTIFETVKLCGRTDTEYTHISEFRPPQARENAGALRKRSYFENAIATCSEDELREQLMKRFRTSDDLLKFLQQAMSQQ